MKDGERTLTSATRGPSESSRLERTLDAWRLYRTPSGLLVGAVVLAAVDWLWPLGGPQPWLIALAWSVAVPPFIAVMLRPAPTPALVPARPSGTSGANRGKLRRILLHGVLLSFLIGFIAAKWMLVLHARTATESLVDASRSYTLAILLVYAVGLLGRGFGTMRFFALAAEHPARLMALSFGATGVFGALVLSLPISAAHLHSVSLIDNVFMAFSAVCVTGLATQSVSQDYSLFGQVVLCALVQVGGLGIMVLSAAVVALAGRRMGLRNSAVLAQMVDVTSLASLRRTLLSIVAYTLAIEAAGATLLYLRFVEYEDSMAGAGSVAWAAVFHALMAFCNAGLSNLDAGLMPFRSDPYVLSVLSVLILLGGIGFPVLDALGRAAVTKLRRKRLRALDLHTRVVLRTSALLVVLLSLAYIALEWNASFAALPWYERIMAAVFQSISTRSGGLSVIDLALMTPAALVLTCAAMFIGAAPGSAGGGIKTTTLAALFAGLRAELGASAPRLLDRTLPPSVIRKAIGVAVLSMTIIFGVIIAMLVIEDHPPLPLVFEVVSAFTTTGLSTGITPELSVAGKLVITLTMFVGRIGPLTLALALSVDQRAEPLELPAERVMVG